MSDPLSRIAQCQSFVAAKDSRRRARSSALHRASARSPSPALPPPVCRFHEISVVRSHHYQRAGACVQNDRTAFAKRKAGPCWLRGMSTLDRSFHFVGRTQRRAANLVAGAWIVGNDLTLLF